MKKLAGIVLMLYLSVQTVMAAGTVATYVIDPEKNAFQHNNFGVMYVEEKNYYAAIQEFKIATYFNNLGKVYMIIGYPDLARDCFENALVQYPLNFEYYKNLVNCYEKSGIVASKLQEYKVKKKKSMLDNITLALLYEKSGDIKKAIFILDEFATSEPALLITPPVKRYIQELVNILESSL